MKPQYYSIDSQVLIAGDILSRPDIASAIFVLHNAVLSAVKTLDKNEAERALNQFIAALKKCASKNDVIIAWLCNLGLCLLEYALGQGVIIKENVCLVICEQNNTNCACERLTHYIFKIIDEKEQQINKTVKHGRLAVEYINQNYMKPNLSTKDVLSFLSVSSSHFSVIFKNYTGESFINFLSKLRIEKACELLLTTDKMNYEIAVSVGYEDSGYFRRIFKKFTGLNPSEFRKIKKSK